ncbi:MAG: helix-turn-helix transcriptional regulator [Anaeromyxobacter sp.]|nr:helix-turn-helix transcriptional regulator [Anaeromyxobacter sp.]
MCAAYRVSTNRSQGVEIRLAVTLRTAFGLAVRKLREARKISQEHLAELAGVHRTYMGAVERGEKNISIDNIERISAALGVRASSVLTRAEDLRSPRADK